PGADSGAAFALSRGGRGDARGVRGGGHGRAPDLDPANARRAGLTGGAARQRTDPAGGGGARPGSPPRFLLAAFGEPGHAFPMIALGRELAARGDTVCLQTWERWREFVEAEGMRFDRAPEYAVFPTSPALKPYQAAVRAAEETLPLVRSFSP